MNPAKLISACLVSLCLLSPASLAGEITVAVAANFTPVMRELAAAFEEETGDHVVVTFGSSGRLYAQIMNGAPFDLFFSADQDKPAALVSAGKADAASRFTYARGKLVLWSADAAMSVENGAALRANASQRIALANPRLAPYGLAAEQVLAKLAAQGITANNRVTGESITQAYQYVDTGNVPLGFVALSQVIDNGRIQRGSGWIIPQNMYDPISQDAVLLTDAKDKKVAQRFLIFVQSDTGKSLITKYGYEAD